MRNFWFILAIVAFLAASCAGGSSSASAGGNATNNKSQKQLKGKALEFPYVELPPYIREQGEAARYIVRNFWKPYFKSLEKDTSILCLDSAKFESAFANYANALIALERSRRGKDKEAGDKTYAILSGSQKMVFAKADSLYQAGHKSILMRLIELSEKYFYNPNSPYLNEEVYIPALEAVLGLESLDQTAKLTYKWQLDIASLNRIGTKANDFEFTSLNTSSNGGQLRKGSLHKIKAEYLLLYFNNPDCNSCKGQMEILLSSPQIVQMIELGQMKVLSMYIDEDVELWKKHRVDAPQNPNWIYARDHKLILRDNELYGIRAIPSMYLLNGNKEVILKDAVAEMIVQHFK
ncbi:MAG: DUF5106 domain-containing protein [Bacteroidales bacterium]|nr:DUF5106 domain-containing protein [Bacteroidales bacterium]